MSLQLKPLHPLFVAEVSGIDIAKPIDAATVRAIDDAMDKYGVLVFRGQPLDQDQQVAFASRFGTCLLYTSPSPRDRQKSRMPSSA